MTEHDLRALFLRWCRCPGAITPEVTAAGLLQVWHTPEHALAWLMRLRSRDEHFHAAQRLLEGMREAG